ncbi:MAG: hypothetical protein ACTSU9_15820 [Promethearchaeota archaeon]
MHSSSLLEWKNGYYNPDVKGANKKNTSGTPSLNKIKGKLRFYCIVIDELLVYSLESTGVVHSSCPSSDHDGDELAIFTIPF